MATLIEITTNNKITSASVDAVKLRDEHQQDVLYIHEPVEKELTDTSFLTVESQGYPEFFQMGSLYINRTRIQSIKELNNKFYIQTTRGYYFEVATIPYTIDEMLSFAGENGGTGTGGGEIAGTWDMTPVGGSALPFDDLSGFTEVGGTLIPSNLDSVKVAMPSVAASDGSIVEVANTSTVVTGGPLFIYIGYINAEASSADVLGLLASAPTPAFSAASFITVAVGTDNQFIAQNMTTGGVDQFFITDNQVHTANQLIRSRVTVVGSDYLIEAQVDGDSVWHTVGTIVAANAPTGVKPVIVGVYTGGHTGVITGANLGGSAGVVNPPASPVGKRYTVSVGGTYLGQSANTGDIVEFITLTDIFVTRDINLLGSNPVITDLQTEVVNLWTANGDLDTRVTTLENDVAGLGVRGEMVIQEFTGVVEGTTTIDLSLEDTGNLKRITWGSVTDYVVHFTQLIGERFSFTFELVLDDGNEFLAEGERFVEIKTAVQSNIISSFRFDAKRLKRIFGYYDNGVISFYAREATNLAGVFSIDKNPCIYGRLVTANVDTASGITAPTFSGMEILRLTSTEDNAVVNISTIPASGSAYRLTDTNLLKIELLGSSFSFAAGSIDSAAILPAVASGQVKKFIYDFRTGALIESLA